jgi:hypothetical protein
MAQQRPQAAGDEWVSFPGGELEGRRPRALCRDCREALRAAALDAKVAPRRTLCFQCYRADLERDRSLRQAGALDTGSAERFQFQLPFETIDRARLASLKTARAEQRAATLPYVDKRRHAQIAARHALAQIAAGLRARGLGPGTPAGDRALFQAVHAAELQLPESWLPFVVSR